jgi:dynein heavy chain
LLATIDPNVPVKKGKLDAEIPWKACLKLMGNPAALLETLRGFGALVEKDQVPAMNFKAIRPTLAEETFTKELILIKSQAAGGICDWVINITMYYDVVVSVEPKKIAVAEAQEQLAAANAKKAEMEELVADLTDKLNKLMVAYDAAMDKKNKAEAEAARCASRLDLANRLVTALGSESERWSNSIIQLGEDIELVVGDVLLASAFVSYVGPFSKQFRENIITGEFI